MNANRLIVVHYDEIAMKGGRRRYFERKLVRNIRKALSTLGDVPIKFQYDRILIGPLPEEQVADVQERLADVPGVAWFSQVARLPVEVDSLQNIADEFAAGNGNGSFRVQARRSKKDFPLNSLEINRRLGAMIQERTGQPVDLSEPDATVYVDVTPQGILAYDAKERGPGGLPADSNGRLVCLLSGGIDSPVAAYKMLCRGCGISFVHFHNLSPEAGNVRRKILRLAEEFTRFQPRTRLYLVPFGRVQSDLVAAVPPRMRMVAYRRAMFRLAAPLLEREEAQGFVVGDSVGQVASQTLENLQATWPATDYPVFAPLIGESKQSIMEQAKQIGTYKTSILPYEDCCQLLVAKSPETKCTLEEIGDYEAKLPFEEYHEELRDEIEVIDFEHSREAVSGGV